jgi:Lrp/AsnC family transcriptional regulator for asnA, asnC and gidA
MQQKLILDEIDNSIIHELLQDAEKPFIQIAKTLNISNSLVHQRVARLKLSGIIEKTEVKLSEKHLGYETCAFSGIVLSEDPESEKVIELLKGIPEIVECYYISGKFTLYVKIVARNNDHLRQILYEKINSIKSIVRTETIINFGTAFKRNPPLPECNE